MRARKRIARSHEQACYATLLQEILGHASMETTRGYLHPDDRHLASAAEQANGFLSPSG